MNDPTKHLRYQDQYKSNDYFWGLGIENETYFQFSKPQAMNTKAIYTNHKPERYSVNYFKGLNPEYKILLKTLYPISDSAIALSALTDSEPELTQTYDIPTFMNAHTLQKTDISGNHETTYEKEPKPNPKFLGKTIHDLLTAHNPDVFLSKYKVNYMYDGDTIEFMTQNFYKTTVKANVKELITEKALYIEALNKSLKELNLFQELGPVSYPSRNEPFVCFLTNMNNIAIFNNGTYHINITMPTQLDGNKKSVNPLYFVSQHKAAIRYIQYLEPLIIALYGTPDPFSTVSDCYSKASQRCAVSRYIGIGTYNTDVMETGKILSVETNACKASAKPYWWYTQYTKTSHYNPLPKIGVDINFNKHGTHGIELRFLDWFPEDRLEELMTVLIHLMDYSLLNGLPADPTVCPVWNGLVVKMLKTGPNAVLSDEEYDMYDRVFNLTEKPYTFFGFLECFHKPDKTVKTLSRTYEIIVKKLKTVNGLCTKYML